MLMAVGFAWLLQFNPGVSGSLTFGTEVVNTLTRIMLQVGVLKP
jgi:hypothetical protein